MEKNSTYMCIYMLGGMQKVRVYGETLKEIHDMLAFKEIVSDLENEITEMEMLDKIYSEAHNTTAHLTIFKLNEGFDPETADEDESEYIVWRNK